MFCFKVITFYNFQSELVGASSVDEDETIASQEGVSLSYTCLFTAFSILVLFQQQLFSYFRISQTGFTNILLSCLSISQIAK